MGKIKGWKKFKDYDEWHNDFSSIRLNVKKVEELGWVIAIANKNTDEALILKVLQTKFKALKYAVKYMKNKPRG